MKLLNKIKDLCSTSTNNQQPSTEPTATYFSTGRPVHAKADPATVAQIQQDKSWLTHLHTHYAALQLEYSSLPLHTRRDLHTAASEELIYAAAILEADWKDLTERPTEHGEEELCPVARNWFNSLGHLMRDFSRRGVDRFEAEYVNDLHRRVDDEIARFTKTQEMVDHIRHSASFEPSAPLGTMLREWNQACSAIERGRHVGTAVREAIEASQESPGALPPYPKGDGRRRHFVLNVTEAKWPSASWGSGTRQKPEARWTPREEVGRAEQRMDEVVDEELPAYRA